MKAKILGAMILALASLGLAQPSPFSVKVALFEVVVPSVSLQTRLGNVDNLGIELRVGYVVPYLGLGEAYVFWVPPGQEHWTILLGGGWLGLWPPSGFLFVGGGLEYGWEIPGSKVRSSIEVGVVFARYNLNWFYGRDPGQYWGNTGPLPLLRFSFIFPL